MSETPPPDPSAVSGLVIGTQGRAIVARACTPQDYEAMAGFDSMPDRIGGEDGTLHLLLEMEQDEAPTGMENARPLAIFFGQEGFERFVELMIQGRIPGSGRKEE